MSFEHGSKRHKHVRLIGYDYRQAGIYVLTVVVRERRCCLGAVVDYEFVPAPAAGIVRAAWERLPDRFPTLVLDEFIVMPNHVHGIVFLGGNPVVAEQVAMNGDATDEPDTVASPFMATPHPKTKSPDHEGRVLRPPSRDGNAPALGEIVRSLKASSTTRIRQECISDFAWQDGYWDRIVRSDAELDRFRGYIATNPERWTLDREYAER